MTPDGLNHVLAQQGASVRRDQARVVIDVLTERVRQDCKWGVQEHPSVDKGLLSRPTSCSPLRMAEEYEIPTADRAKALCQIAAERNACTWAHIAVEELCEAVEAGVTGDVECREELVQLAAVVVAWIECLDRRASKTPTAAK